MKEKMKDSCMTSVTFNGDVTFNGPMFDIHDNEHVHIGVETGIMSSKCKGEVREMDSVQLARAIENCQQYFWANASYAVVFCICRDEYKKKMSKTDFETMIEDLPYKKKRSHTCPTGTIANAFSDNLIYNDPVNEWDHIASKRIVKLRDELRRELKL